MLRRGGSIALFPEGISHNSPKLLPIKTGAARIALGAASINSETDPVDVLIVPVGLYYTSKTKFRSEALLHFGETFEVPKVELDPDGQPPRDAVKALTERIESALHDVTLNAESDSELFTARIAEEIFSAAAETGSLRDELSFLKSYVSRVDPELSSADRELESKLLEFDKKLERRGIEPVHLSLAKFPRSFVIKEAILQSWLLIILAPFALIGAILHFPAYQLCRLFAYLFTHHGADDIVSTVKVLAAMVFMPLTWIVTAIVMYFVFDWRSAAVSIPVSIILGYIALYTLEEAAELRGWANAVWLYITRKEEFLKLFVERRQLQKELRDIGRG